MLELLIILGAIAFPVLILTKWIMIYNEFKTLAVTKNRQHAGIQVLLKQRILMYNSLGKTVTSYNKHEYGTQVDTIKQRGNGLGGGFINAVVESYPKLESSDLHGSVLGEDSITDIEKRIRDDVTRHNWTCQQFNSMLNKFPTSVIGNYHKFEALEYFSFDNVAYDNVDIFAVKQ